MDKQVKIEKIVIRIGEKQAELTLEDAKALRDVLNGMFGKEKEYVPYYSPVIYPTNPWPWNPYRPYWEPWITYTSGHTKRDWGGITLTYNSSGSSFLAG